MLIWRVSRIHDITSHSQHLLEIALLSKAVAGLTECSVSIRRIQTFLECPEQTTKRSQQIMTESKHKSEIMTVSNVTCHWNSEPASGSAVALSNINVGFKPGELTCVIGEVGSGKVRGLCELYYRSCTLVTSTCMGLCRALS